MNLFNKIGDAILIWGILTLLLSIIVDQFVEYKKIWHLFAILNIAWITSTLICLYKWR